MKRDIGRVRDAIEAIDGDLVLLFASEAGEATRGLVALATIATVLEGVNADEAVTPASLKAALDARIAAIVGGAPGALDALNELATALGNDPSFAATISGLIGTKVSQTVFDAAVGALNTAVGGKVGQGAFEAAVNAINATLSDQDARVTTVANTAGNIGARDLYLSNF